MTDRDLLCANRHDLSDHDLLIRVDVRLEEMDRRVGKLEGCSLWFSRAIATAIISIIAGGLAGWLLPKL